MKLFVCRIGGLKLFGLFKSLRHLDAHIHSIAGPKALRGVISLLRHLNPYVYSIAGPKALRGIVSL